MNRRPSPIRSVLQQARRELTLIEQIGECVVLPLLCCTLFGMAAIFSAVAG